MKMFPSSVDFFSQVLALGKMWLVIFELKIEFYIEFGVLLMTGF